MKLASPKTPVKTYQSVGEHHTDGKQLPAVPVFQAKVGDTAQLVTKYTKLTPNAAFLSKHLSANASQNLCSAMLIARKYKGWQSDAPKHTLITNANFPAAAAVAAPAAGYKESKPLTMITHQYIASHPQEVTAGTKWTVNSKTTVKNPSVGGALTALIPGQPYSNGSGSTPTCNWDMAVNHLAGANDDGLNPTTVEWLAGTSQYRVTRGDIVNTYAQATVEQP